MAFVLQATWDTTLTMADEESEERVKPTIYILQIIAKSLTIHFFREHRLLILMKRLLKL